MGVQAENIQSFQNGVSALALKIGNQVDELFENSNNPEVFAEIADDMDSLYEMARTVKYKEFAKYTKIIKEICVICPLADNSIAYKKGLNMISTFLDNKDILFKGLTEPNILPMASSKVNHAYQKMEVFQRTFATKASD